MRILMLHNFYRQPGGEDTCYYTESEMLRKHGDDAVSYTHLDVYKRQS